MLLVGAGLVGLGGDGGVVVCWVGRGVEDGGEGRLLWWWLCGIEV